MTKYLLPPENRDEYAPAKRLALEFSTDDRVVALVTLFAQRAAERDYAAYLRKRRDENEQESPLS